MKIEQTAPSPPHTVNFSWQHILRSKRFKGYGMLACLLVLGVVALKLLFPPVSQDVLMTSGSPLIEEDAGTPQETVTPQDAAGEAVLPDSHKEVQDDDLTRTSNRGQSSTVMGSASKDRTSKTVIPSPSAQITAKAERESEKKSMPAVSSRKREAHADLLEIKIFNRGVTYLQGRQPYRAIIEFNKVISMNPMNHEAYNNLGLALWAAGEEKEAGEALEKALVIRPDYIKCRNNLALLYMKRGEASRAIDLFDGILSIHPENGEAWANLGVAYRREGRLQDAEKAYSRALALSPEDYRIYFNLAQTLELQGRISEALFHYERFLRLLPRSEAAKASEVLQHMDNLKRSAFSQPDRPYPVQ